MFQDVAVGVLGNILDPKFESDEHIFKENFMARIQRAPNHRDLRRYTTSALRRDHNAYWNAFAAVVATCGNARKLYQTLKSVSRRPAKRVRCYLNSTTS